MPPPVRGDGGIDLGIEKRLDAFANLLRARQLLPALLGDSRVARVEMRTDRGADLCREGALVGGTIFLSR